MKARRPRSNYTLSLMYEFTRDLAVSGEADAILRTIITHVGRALGREAAVWLPQEGGTLAIGAVSPGFELAQNELAAAEWAFRHNQTTGQGTDSFPVSRTCCRPLQTPRGVVGVLGVTSGGSRSSLTAEQLRLIEVFASPAALAIERAQLAEHAHQVHLLQATEKLQSALLHSISHDLRTPLVIITVALSNLEAAGDRLDAATRQSLAHLGRQEAERLNRMVGNLLDLTRIEAGALHIITEPCEVEEAIGPALDRLAPEPEDRPPGWLPVDSRPVFVDVPPDLPPVPMDQALMVQALANVLDNAVKYSPDGSQIDVIARSVEDQVEIRVADRGEGIPPENLAHIFDKFYRVQRPDGVQGTGLGLAISKGIVEAHGGRIWAEERPGGGTIVTIALPLHPPPVRSGS